MSFKLVFGCVPFIVWALTCLAFVRPSRLGKAAKGVWCGVLLVCFGKFLWFKLLGGDAFVPDLPEKLIWFMNWFYSGAFALFALAAVVYIAVGVFVILNVPEAIRSDQKEYRLCQHKQNDTDCDNIQEYTVRIEFHLIASLK